MSTQGVVAAGHEATAQAAIGILDAGGNAFDAIVAAHFAACVAEPVLCSLGGGGFLIGQAAQDPVRLFDFFAHTPKRKRPPDQIDFRPILADFGAAQQEFHIGLGAIATPGAVAGMFAVHRALCTLPMAVLLEPALALARDGVVVNPMQAYAFRIVAPIFSDSEAARRVFASPSQAGALVQEGDLLRQPELATVLECLARQGEAWFYGGEFAHLVAELCANDGGYLTLADLQDYAVQERKPLQTRYRGARVWTNPPPSSGGLLIAFALQLLAAVAPPAERGSSEQLCLLAEVMALTQQARLDAHLEDAVHPDAERLLEAGFIERYRREIRGRPASHRGTTHINVMDGLGNQASLTVSNGEGCGRIIPDTGVMLNNMLGEADLNPLGFHRWPEDTRMTSMMAPTLVETAQGARLALGSGGSNRIRTAILQVLVNLLDYGAAPCAAVEAPRLHMEDELLSVEQGFEPESLAPLLTAYPRHQCWDDSSLFFGGVHLVQRRDGVLDGAGDPRRGGVVRHTG